MDLSDFIYWLLVLMGACFLVTGVLVILHISIYASSVRIYPEMPDTQSVSSRYSERESKASTGHSDNERLTFHFRKESIICIRGNALKALYV